MKNILKIASILALVLVVFSCEEESNFEEPNIELVPVYAITNITGTNALYQINVYKDTPLTVEYVAEVQLNSYDMLGFQDASTDTEYNVSWGVVKDRESGDLDADDNVIMENYTVNYVLTGSKEWGTGVLNASNVYADGTTLDLDYTVSIANEEVYN
ncbi:hypothetical protein [Formosa sp. PL04]|uniref:hypothetical protein n=1 Tax=Formosa sp. PL04 TaxID=3081755 RepID=UPI0029813AC1|nr:hypothetical protein [Formosa sp. PL04]MDW5288071.1 hypothetical protein [Formosa sp. PL04]